jgi:peptidoglycan/xylan/chitin deacetylase (PgdA/CDA1 family)
VRELLRGSLDRLLVRAVTPGLVRRRRQGRDLVLAYHNVLPPDYHTLDERSLGDRSLHLPWSDFVSQLDALEHLCAVVPLTDLLEPAGRDRPRVALTFDDGYCGAVTLAVPELHRRGLPATLFVAPGLLGRQTFWWDEVACAAGGDGVAAALRRRALVEWAGRGDRIRAEAKRLGLGLETARLPACCRSASEPELAAALVTPGISVAGHSWSHPNLAALDGAELEEELVRPLQWLQERFPHATIPWLAYPYGLDNLSVHRRLGAAGYAAALRVDGGWLPPGQRPVTHLPRRNVPAGIGPGRFRAWLAGLP